MKNNPQLIRDAALAVDFIMNQASSVKAVLISTEDGFEVASRTENTAQIKRLSAMASSLAALGALAGEESRLGECKNLIVEAEFGLLIILQVRIGTDTLIMSVIAGKDAAIGQVLYYAKDAARTLARAP
ncbi:roadblock/LC7 domain-containing protein [Sapientia aquatica]|uniref:Roadblock/LAMTOR2 domain-containing protein n=1 Tax=Sapientia aquatica TaxID=1549640 RepID=A0A4R5VY50_9BURK|nr:hypothetical protein [Sapientia aquatica]TDK64415.1 hypothetical protein E2I14_13280 [Sapientia aquatica]